MRFLKELDYEMQVRTEIMRILAEPTDWYQSAKLVRAEQTAIAQTRNRIGHRYDMGKVFAPVPDGEPDTRDQWIVTLTIDMALYHLYSQSNMRDIPEHRQQRYQDALEWLKDVGNGHTFADLPDVQDDKGNVPDQVFISSRAPENHRW